MTLSVDVDLDNLHKKSDSHVLLQTLLLACSFQDSVVSVSFSDDVKLMWAMWILGSRFILFCISQYLSKWNSISNVRKDTSENKNDLWKLLNVKKNSKNKQAKMSCELTTTFWKWSYFFKKKKPTILQH